MRGAGVEPEFVDFDSAAIAQAFPVRLRMMARANAPAWERWVHRRYQSHRFAVRVEGERVLIPQRILLPGYTPPPALDPEIRAMGWCVLTRSTDGFERQNALEQIVTANLPWTIPFVVALIGEYVIEMLDIIEAALPGIDPAVLGGFLVENPAYLALTEARVTSYWNAYYRADFGRADREWRGFTRKDYVGFRLIAALRDIERKHRDAMDAARS